MTTFTPAQADTFREQGEQLAHEKYSLQNRILDELAETGGSTIATHIDAIDVLEEGQDDEFFVLAFRVWASRKIHNEEKQRESVNALFNKLDSIFEVATNV